METFKDTLPTKQDPAIKELMRIIQDHRPQFEAGRYEHGEMTVSPYWFCNNCPWQMDITEPDNEQDKHLAQVILEAGFRKTRKKQ